MLAISSNYPVAPGFEWHPATFGEVVICYQARIHRFICSIVGDIELAYDLTQDTFLAAYRNLCRRYSSKLDNADEIEFYEHWQQIQAQNNMAAWLYAIARNVALGELRRRKVRGFFSFFQRPNPGTDAEASSLANIIEVEKGGSLEAQVALQDELQQAIQKVGRAKLVPLLLHIDGFSYKEISNITGDSLANVKVKIFRAKESLRQALET